MLDGRVSINQIDDWGFTSFYGLTYQLNDKAMIGVVYRPEFDANLEGDVNFSNFVGPTPTADSIDVDWTNPQVLQVGLQYKMNDKYTLFVDADWEDWSEFSDNQLSFQGGSLNPVVSIDRNWKDTYHLGVGRGSRMGQQIFAVGVCYDSSPVDDDDRTIDLPVDEQLKFSMAYGRIGEKARLLARRNPDLSRRWQGRPDHARACASRVSSIPTMRCSWAGPCVTSSEPSRLMAAPVCLWGRDRDRDLRCGFSLSWRFLRAGYTKHSRHPDSGIVQPGNDRSCYGTAVRQARGDR